MFFSFTNIRGDIKHLGFLFGLLSKEQKNSKENTKENTKENSVEPQGGIGLGVSGPALNGNELLDALNGNDLPNVSLNGSNISLNGESNEETNEIEEETNNSGISLGISGMLKKAFGYENIERPKRGGTECSGCHQKFYKRDIVDGQCPNCRKQNE